MAPNTVKSLILFSSVAVTAQAALDPQLTGTWSTKSRKVITGPVRLTVYPTIPVHGRELNSCDSYC
jgi:hypothetical protein